MPLIPLITNSRPVADAPGAVLDTQRRPTVDNSEVSQAAGQLGSIKTPLLNADALAAPYEALGTVGRAITQTGSVMGALAMKKMEAETDNRVSDASNYLNKSYGEFVASLKDDQDPATWEKRNQERLSAAKTDIFSSQNLSPEARDRIGVLFNKHATDTAVDMMKESSVKTFGIARDNTQASINQKIDAQDRPGTEQMINYGVSKGYIQKHVGDGLLEHFDKVGEQKKKEAEVAAFDAAHNSIVADVESLGGDAVKEKLNKGDYGNYAPVDKLGLEKIADDAQRTFASEIQEKAFNSIVSGDFKTPMAIDALQSPNLTPKVRDELKLTIQRRNDSEIARSISEDQALNGERNFVELRQTIADYKPEDDPDHSGEAHIRNQILERVPSGMHATLGDALTHKLAPDKAGISPENKKYEVETLDRVFNPVSGIIPWRSTVSQQVDSVDKKTGKPVKEWKLVNVDDPAKQDAAYVERASVETKLGDWMKLNPNDAKDAAKIGGKIMEYMQDGSRKRALDLMKSTQPAKPSAAVGTVTSYGYAQDSTPDNNSAHGVGAFVPDTEAAKIKAGQSSDYKLREGDIAVSPDIADSFRKAGVKPMGSVMLSLANGEKRLSRWADLTANDQQIKSGQVKGVTVPLRGRFDFYSKGGKHPLDGTQVTGWEPVKNA